MPSIGQTTRPGYVYDSGTDTWIPIGIGPHSHSDYIPNSIVDAKGDLITATGNDVPARIAAGSNGSSLVADSTTSTGLRWQEPKADNPVINSAFQVWQRGTSLAGNTTSYHADRWRFFTANTNSTLSRQNTSDTTNLPNIQYCARAQRTSGNSATDYFYLNQPFETVNTIPFVGKTVTFSFYARAGANYSAASNALFAYISTGTGTDQSWVAGYTGFATPIYATATLTTSWQRFSYTGTIATSATELAIVFEARPTGTASTNDYFEVTGVQLEVGSVATPFKTYSATLAGELAACQRYYQVIGNGAAGGADDTARAAVGIALATTMRAAPTLAFVGQVTVRTRNGAITATSPTFAATYRSTTGVVALIDGFTGFTTGSGLVVIGANFADGANILTANAEL